VPVLDPERRVVGTIAVSDLVRAYRTQLVAHLTSVRSPADSSAGVFEIEVEPGSELAGARLRDVSLPPGVLVTAIRRGGDVLAPAGNTVICAGDRLSAIGPVERLRGATRPSHRF
jgi:Trk K+ transport system NAD-binding subunit